MNRMKQSGSIRWNMIMDFSGVTNQSVIRLEWAYVGMMEVMYILINLSQMKNEVIKWTR